MNLYEIPDKYISLMEIMEDCEEANLKEAIENSMEDIKDNLSECLADLAKVIINIRSGIDARNSEIARLSAISQREENKLNHIKSTIKAAMIATEVKNIKTDLLSFSIQKGRESTKVFDESRLSDEYLKVEIISKPILKDVKKGIEAGLIPEDVAKIVVGEPSLSVK